MGSVSGRMGRREFGLGAAAAALCAAAWGEGGVPGRIVSTAPSSTETLFALGLGRNVVGVSVYCEYPPEVKSLPKVGSYMKPNVEQIVRLRPDLVVLQRHEGSIAGQLRGLGIRFVEMPYGLLADVYAGVSAVAGACGVAARGVALNEEIRGRLEAVKVRAAKAGRVRAMVIADRRAGTLTELYAVGSKNYVNEMMEIAGGVNVLGEGGAMYPHISLETVLRTNPEVIVDMTDAHDADEAHEKVRAQDKALWGAHPELVAVKAGRVFVGTSVVLLVPGPRTPEAVELFYGYFHGDGRFGSKG